MRTRTLTLRRENLADLSEGQLATLAGASAACPTHICVPTVIPACDFAVTGLCTPTRLVCSGG